MLIRCNQASNREYDAATKSDGGINLSQLYENKSGENTTEGKCDNFSTSNLNKLFKAYDVRGRTDTQELTPAIMHRIGAVFASTMDSQRIIIGRDCRLTSNVLTKAFNEGIIRQGKDVLDLGLITADGLYYATAKEAIAGAMITASHNPGHYNGVKLSKAGAVPLSSEELIELRDKMTLPLVNAGRLGQTEKGSIMPEYIEHLLSIVSPLGGYENLRITVDGSNGMAGPAVEHIFRRLGAELIGIYLEPDGNFPNHPADPSHLDNLYDLIKLTERHQPNLGVIFDGDADRAVFIDEKGKPLSGSTTIALISQWYLANRKPQATIVHDSICSRMTPKLIESYGGRAVRSPVGSPFIKQTLLEADADFAGETSGHYYFKENFAIDSGLLSMLIMMQIVSEASEPLSVLRQKFEHQAIYQATTFKVTNWAGVLEAVAAAFAQRGELDFFDGLIVNWPDKWFSLRSSNTEPLIRLHAEAPDVESLEDIISEIADIIRRYPLID